MYYDICLVIIRNYPFNNSSGSNPVSELDAADELPSLFDATLSDASDDDVTTSAEVTQEHSCDVSEGELSGSEDRDELASVLDDPKLAPIAYRSTMQGWFANYNLPSKRPLLKLVQVYIHS